MKKHAILILLVAMAPACRYASVASAGARNPTPYRALDCFDEDNAEGFSFEVPACYCTGGIRFRYVANRAADGSIDIVYEQERGFLTESEADDVLVVSTSPTGVDHLVVGGRELPRPTQCSDADRALWSENETLFTSFVDEYAPLFAEMQRICAEDRIDATLASGTGAHPVFDTW